jgi:predicted nucleotidyltransferase
MPYGLSEGTLARIRGVLASHAEVERAVLYGSRAQGNYRDGSDIDLCLMGESLTLAE